MTLTENVHLVLCEGDLRDPKMSTISRSSKPPLTTAQRVSQWKTRNANRTKRLTINLPKSAYQELQEVAHRTGLSTPALLLATLDFLSKADTPALIHQAGIKGKLHGLRITVESNNGTRSRIKAGRYLKATGND